MSLASPSGLGGQLYSGVSHHSSGISESDGFFSDEVNGGGGTVADLSDGLTSMINDPNGMTRKSIDTVSVLC